jgi:hypothetical protein
MNNAKVGRIVTYCCGALLAAAGQASCATEMPNIDAQRRVEARNAAAPPLADRVPEATPPVKGEAPADLVAKVRADAARRSQEATGELQVVRDEAVTWNDGSLGCPRVGAVYPQVPVAGYWIVLRAAGREFDYRVDDRGRYQLCESSRPMDPPVANPTK